jgi:hypothetical protein
LNIAVLDHVVKQGTKLANALTAYCSAITGDCISCQTFQGKRVDLSLQPPTMSSALGQFVSYLVLLFDSVEPAIPDQPQLPWIPPGGIPKVKDFVDQSGLIDVTNEIMAVQGTATAHDDFPVVCLNKHPIGYRAIR